MDTRRLLIAALLSMVVLLGWQALFPPEQSETPAEVEQRAPAADVGAETVPEPARDDRAPESALADTAPIADSTTALDEPEQEAPREPIYATAEETRRLTGRGFQAEFSNRGGQLVSLRLDEHSTRDGQPVDLVRARQDFAYPFGWVDARGGDHPLNNALFKVADETTSDRLVFEYLGPEGSARKVFELTPEGLLGYEVSAEADEPWHLAWGPGIRNPTDKEAQDRFARRSAVYSMAGEVERIQALKARETQVVAGQGLRWIGLQDSYFLAAIVPGEGLEQVSVLAWLTPPPAQGGPTFQELPLELEGDQKDWLRELQIVMRPEQSLLTGQAFLGSKQFDRLAALPFGLEETVNLGFFGLLGRPLLYALQWIYKSVVANYGWAIVLLTLAIRLLLFPLNHKSIVSMRKMQKVNPKMQAIRQKYRSKLKDKRGRPNAEAQAKMNQEIMALYKQEGVNPAAGCLPMLLQMPVLFAFYSLLTVAVELRQAPWMGWIKDLSAPDPYYILPWVMGASMFVQQKLSPPAQDPMQRRIFMMMPIMFTVFFLGFPAGLVIYWLTNNVLAIAQQLGYQRWREAHGDGDEEDAPSAAHQASKKKGGKDK